MRPSSITRAELHTLVWSEPRSKLAKSWGISDVAIGKLCAKEHIPAPPPGYWARKIAGKKCQVTPLPIRLPGQRPVLDMRSKTEMYRWNAPVDLVSEIPFPTYSETIEEVVDAAVRRLGRTRASRDLTSPHGGLRKVLASEEQRAERSKGTSWSNDKPHFAEARFQRQLRIFSSIFQSLDALRAGCEVRENQTWIQGIGHVYHLTGIVVIGHTGVHIQFLEPENPKNCSEIPRSAVSTLRIGHSDCQFDFVDAVGSKIVRRLDDIARSILITAERNLRSSDLVTYEWKQEQRARHLRELAERKRQDEAKLQALLQAKRDAIRKEIADAAEALRRAHDIRSLVDAMASHPDYQGEGLPAYIAWSKAALAEANALDPLLQPTVRLFSAWQSNIEGQLISPAIAAE